VDHEQLQKLLGDDLFALAEELPAAIIERQPLRGRGPSASMRLLLADGSLLKAKRLPSVADAERVERLLQHLHHPAFPAVRLRRGALIVTKWVIGGTLGPADLDSELVRTCGALHAFVHTRPPVDRLPPRPDARERAIAQLRRDLEALVDGGWLQRIDAVAAWQEANRHAPAAWAVGIVHGDFNAENLVRTGPTEVAVVDNETLSIGAFALDLARTWYRWPMNPPQWRTYLEGYTRHRDAAEFERHLPFWTIAVLARGAVFRWRAGRDGVTEPLVRLRVLLESASAADAMPPR
jgi:thiamine kinase-like enzyme